jgi:hypothetical protein
VLLFDLLVSPKPTTVSSITIYIRSSHDSGNKKSSIVTRSAPLGMLTTFAKSILVLSKSDRFVVTSTCSTQIVGTGLLEGTLDGFWGSFGNCNSLFGDDEGRMEGPDDGDVEGSSMGMEDGKELSLGPSEGERVFPAGPRPRPPVLLFSSQSSSILNLSFSPKPANSKSYSSSESISSSEGTKYKSLFTLWSSKSPRASESISSSEGAKSKSLLTLSSSKFARAFSSEESISSGSK